jgi:DNA-binding MarR family transcriptional regulator
VLENSCRMQIIMIEEQTAEKHLLIHPLADIFEVLGWAQSRVARRETLGPLHITIFRCAARKGRVSFDRICKETGLPRYAVSRAAALLQRQKLGRVQPDKEDKRWKRLHITLLGLKCCERIDLEILRCLFSRFNESHAATSYYELASHLWNATRCLYFFELRDPRQFGFPGAIVNRTNLTAEQRILMRFLDEIQRSAKTREKEHD